MKFKQRINICNKLTQHLKGADAMNKNFKTKGELLKYENKNKLHTEP